MKFEIHGVKEIKTEKIISFDGLKKDGFFVKKICIYNRDGEELELVLFSDKKENLKLI